jgi:hypothetical protein
MLAKIENRPNLVRDLSTQAILNTDSNAVVRHERIVKDFQKQANRDIEFVILKNQVDELKDMISNLINTQVVNKIIG